MEKFGEYLKKQRKNVGLTQETLAGVLDVSAPYIHQLEANKIAPPTEERCRQLAKALDVNFSELWEIARRERLINLASRDGADEEPILNEEEKALIMLLRRLDPDSRRDFNGMVVMLLRRHAGDEIKQSLLEFVKKCA